MSDKVNENKYFIAFMTEKVSKKQFQTILETASREQIVALCVVLYNVGEAEVDKSEGLMKIIGKKTTKKIMRALHSKSNSILKKRKILLAYKNVILKILKLASEKIIELLF